MIIKNIIQEDFTNYKTCAMFIGFPYCTFKCEKECGCTGMCQNTALVKAPNIEINYDEIVDLYLSNPLSRAIVFGGLEPFDSWVELLDLVKEFRKKTDDTIIVYTGYKRSEIEHEVSLIAEYSNIIIKFGRFIPNDTPHYDEVLGVNLASNNQYAERISR